MATYSHTYLTSTNLKSDLRALIETFSNVKGNIPGEVDGAEDYIKRSIEIKPMTTTWSKKFRDMASQEMEHAKSLYSLYKESMYDADGKPIPMVSDSGAPIYDKWQDGNSYPHMGNVLYVPMLREAINYARSKGIEICTAEYGLKKYFGN